jgi:uncharacterized protein (DUF433 family)
MRIELAPRIIVDPDVRFGKPIIEGTRVPVDVVISELAGGMSADDVADEYGLAPDDVAAAMAFGIRCPARSRRRSRRE